MDSFGIPSPATATGSASSRAGWTRWYFVSVSTGLLVLSLIAFSDNLFTDIGQASNSQPRFVVHGVFWLSWMLLLVTQSLLINRRETHLHRRLGVAGAFIALGVTASTLWVFAVAWQGWDAMPFFVKANRMFMALFILAVGLALYWRRHPLRHRRLLLLATFVTLEPVLSRASDHLGFDPNVFNIVVSHLLLGSLVLYDRSAIGRVHGLTVGGIVAFYAVYGLSIAL